MRFWIGSDHADRRRRGTDSKGGKARLGCAHFVFTGAPTLVSTAGTPPAIGQGRPGSCRGARPGRVCIRNLIDLGEQELRLQIAHRRTETTVWSGAEWHEGQVRPCPPRCPCRRTASVHSCRRPDPANVDRVAWCRSISRSGFRDGCGTRRRCRRPS
jgi:hypothetical protein